MHGYPTQCIYEDPSKNLFLMPLSRLVLRHRAGPDIEPIDIGQPRSANTLPEPFSTGMPAIPRVHSGGTSAHVIWLIFTNYKSEAVKHIYRL